MSQSMFLRDYPMSPEQRQAQRIATLERQVRDLQRANVAAPYRVYAEAAGPHSTTSGSYVLLTGGPTVTVDIQVNQMVIITAEIDVNCPTGQSAHWGLYEATDFTDTTISSSDGALGYINGTGAYRNTNRQRALMTNYPKNPYIPGTDPYPFTGRSMLMYYPTPGTRTYELRVGLQGAFASTAFRNRKLWVVVI